MRMVVLLRWVFVAHFQIGQPEGRRRHRCPPVHPPVSQSLYPCG